MAPLPEDAEPMDHAARRIGIPALHEEQRSGIDAALTGEDVLLVMPTGFGKSACYQVPSMLLPKPTHRASGSAPSPCTSPVTRSVWCACNEASQHEPGLVDAQAQGMIHVTEVRRCRGQIVAKCDAR